MDIKFCFVAIMLSRLPAIEEIADAVIHLDEDKIDLDNLNSLNQFIPEKEEVETPPPSPNQSFFP